MLQDVSLIEMLIFQGLFVPVNRINKEPYQQVWKNHQIGDTVIHTLGN